MNNYLNFFILFIFIIGIITNIFPNYNKNIHPLLIGITLLLLSIINSINLNIFINNHWYSYLMFLIIIGGILILFLYFTRFIINIKFKLKWNYLKTIPIKSSIIILFLIILFIYNFNNINFSFFEFNENINLHKNFNNNLIYRNNLKSIIYLYNNPIRILTLLLIIYLFFCLTLIVKFCLIKKKNIRKIN